MEKLPIKAPQIITTINNKGGVGKTTMTYNIGSYLAREGYKVLLIDADPQCNLTLLGLGAFKYSELGLFENDTIYEVIKPLLLGTGDINFNIKPIQLDTLGNLHLLPGHILFADFDDTLNTAYSEVISNSSPSRGFMVLSGLYRYIHETGLKEGFDIILIDASPSLVGSINKTLLLSSDFFVVVTNPDLFSEQGIMNLGQKVEKRNEQRENISLIAKRNSSNINASYLVPGSPTFLGYIVNAHTVYASRPILDEQGRINTIGQKVKTNLSEKHGRNGLVQISHEKPLGLTQDYHRLSSIAQQKQKALFDINESELNSAEGSEKLLEKCKNEINLLCQEFINRLHHWGR